MILIDKFDFDSSSEIGKMMVISKSKIKNKIEIMINWVENGNRFLLIELNPHSNSYAFCFLIFILLVIFKKINVNINVRKIPRFIIVFIRINFYLSF